jgi:hypothetical protein
MEGWQRSGVSQRDYCAQRGLCLSTFTLWRRRLVSKPSRAAVGGVVDLVPVPLSVAKAPVIVAGMQTSPHRTDHAPGPVVVVLGRYRLEVTKGFDAETLRAVLNTLEVRSC